MIAITRTTLLLALTASLALPLHSQVVVPQAVPQPPSEPAELPLSVPGKTPITLDVAVAGLRPKDAAPVLKQSDLQIFDNGHPVQITSFIAPSASSRFALTLVLDAVDANYSSLAFQRGELDKFFSANGGKLAQPTTLAIMTDKGLQVQDGFTSDGAALKQELDDYTIALRTIPRSSGIYGAEERQQLGISALEQLARRQLSVRARKVIVFISPGWPLISGPGVLLDDRQHASIFRTVVSLNNLLQQSRTTVYDVNPFGAAESVLASSYYESFLKPVDRPGRTDLADISLQVQSTQTGGLVRIGTTDLARQIALCVEDAASAYQVTFLATPAESDPRDKSPYALHILRLQAPDGVKTRTRALYYTQSQ